MRSENFNNGWIYHLEGNESKMSVTLPHDAMLCSGRDRKSPGKDANAYFVGGVYVYEKTFTVPAEWEKQHVELAFGGVYRNSKVYVNGKEAGGRPYGYIPFNVSLDAFLKYGEENEIRVVADNSKLPNSRWYSGGGIYRPVELVIGGRDHFAWEGVHITTLSTNPAKIHVAAAVETEEAVEAFEIRMTILDGEAVVAQGSGREADIEIPGAKLWTAETPHLYTCRTELMKDGSVLDQSEETFGIRKLKWSPKGLFINGESLLLRGACIHIDNGILGACSYQKSEDRKIRILKENGFNAIRVSHNPASTELLKACDKYGMYVMDETFDMWFQSKNKYDYALDFREWYLKDTAAMVQHDFNHPSVIMYSIGNEITEPVKEGGMQVAHEMIDCIHAMDNSRAVTAGVNLMILLMSSKGKGLYDEGGAAKKNADKEVSDAKKKPEKEKMSGSLLYNTLMTVLGKGLNRMANSDKADKATSPILDALDIAGYNYASGRYPLEGKKHPNRIVVGSETYPQDIAKNWEMVKKYPYLVGDFMWTGWDYIGEAAIGSWNYEGVSMLNIKYPWLLSGAGAIDILGRPDAEAAYAKCVWGLSDKPYIGVRPANHPGIRVTKSAWRGTDAFDSWAWQNCDGNATIVEVYADASLAKIYLDGTCIGTKKIKKYKALFHVKYRTGTLSVEVFDAAGNKVGSNELKPAKGPVQIAVTPEEDIISAGDIAYVDISMVGTNGITESNADRTLSVSVKNGELVGFGSAKPNPEVSFLEGTYPTYYGKAMVVVRGTQAGNLKIKVSDSKGLEGTAEIIVK